MPNRFLTSCIHTSKEFDHTQKDKLFILSVVKLTIFEHYWVNSKETGLKLACAGRCTTSYTKDFVSCGG
jgi:hypothetical protein